MSKIVLFYVVFMFHTSTASLGLQQLFCKLWMDLNLVHIKSGCVLILDSPGSVLPGSEGRSSACLEPLDNMVSLTSVSSLFALLPGDMFAS